LLKFIAATYMYSFGGTSPTLTIKKKNNKRYGVLPLSGTKDGDQLLVPHIRRTIIMLRE
jgi:hypothetical protein